MRILTITHNYPRWDGDRAGAFVARLAADIVSLGHEMRVVAPHAPGAAEREMQHGVEIVRARYGPDALERVGYTGALREPMRATLLAPLMLPPFIARLWAVAAREARAFRPDAIHAHWWMPVGWIASRLSVPYIVTCHGTDVRLLEKPLWRALALPVMRRAAAITTASEFLARDVARFLPEVAGKISVTSMPMDIELFSAGAGAAKASPPRVLYAGNLIASKGIDVLIEAIALLSARGMPCQLRIIGGGPEEARLHALADARSLGGAISWSPFVSQNALPAEFGAATVTALVSRGQAEGLGLVLAEALLAGSAVVGTAAGGIPEVVVDERTGLIAKDGDAADLARQIERLLTDENLRARTIAGGRERVQAQHAPARAAERVIGLYDGAIQLADRAVAKQRSRA
ncbi:MAG: glycosyltransferase family 4 protein [Gemmatimonadota bacterium]|nr:glycosyltransferase family 4 protein [Gemmatimonadota bacterium]